ncbi:MAG TPA: DUF1214 domain-containing protein [Caulobacteraceae bacterium]|jgi:hypothetical protein
MGPEQTIAQWERFCDGLKTAGREILSTAQDVDEVTQAEGLRYLTRLLRGGIERQIEYADPLEPFMAPTKNERLKWGLDNPDSIYLMTEVDGRYEYELTGNVGSVPYFNLTSAERGEDARQVTSGFLDGAAFKTDAEGNFTVRIGGAEQSENWLRLAERSTTLMLRQTFGDRAVEREMTCRIRLLSDVGPDRPMQLVDALTRTSKAEKFVLNTGRTFLNLAGILRQDVNGLSAADETIMQAMGGDPNYRYFWSAFRIEPDEALLVHLPEVPECENWGLCLYNYWLESLDYTRARINLNKFTTTPNLDGSVTMVLAHRRPDGGEWLDTCNHVLGNMMFRWTSAKKVVAPQTTLVRLDAIDWPKVLQRWGD